MAESESPKPEPAGKRKPEVISEIPASLKGHGRTAKLIAVIGAISAFFAAVVVPPVVAYINRPPKPKANTEEVLKALKEGSEKQAKDLEQMNKDMMEMRGWLKGYLTANGVVIRDPDDPRPPASDPVEVVHPLTRKKVAPGGKPEVLTPMPAPRPLSKPTEIPDPFVPQ